MGQVDHSADPISPADHPRYFEDQRGEHLDRLFKKHSGALALRLECRNVLRVPVVAVSCDILGPVRDSDHSCVKLAPFLEEVVKQGDHFLAGAALLQVVYSSRVERLFSVVLHNYYKPSFSSL